MSIRGSIDNLTESGAAGWLYAPAEKGVVNAQAHLFGRIIGQAMANLYRPDLFEAGVGDGQCGFSISFYVPVSAEHLPMVTVRPQGGDVELPRTNLTGFPDFFRAVQARFPAASRNRSVFGGLWTDRTDAARILSSRIASGATAPDLEEVLRAFIENGFAVLRGVREYHDLLDGDAALMAEAPTGEPLTAQAGPAARPLLEALPDVLFRDAPLRVCRAVLDDNPTVCRTTVHRGNDPMFSQPSTAGSIPSPTECLVSVIVSGPGAVEIDVIRDSHTLPEFTADGRSRWTSPDAAAAVEIAIAHGASVDTIELTAEDVAIIGPGMLHRVRSREASAAACTWSIPSRQTPLSMLAPGAERALMRHDTGAMMVI
jgi:hypothetical protein